MTSRGGAEVTPDRRGTSALRYNRFRVCPGSEPSKTPAFYRCSHLADWQDVKRLQCRAAILPGEFDSLLPQRIDPLLEGGRELVGRVFVLLPRGLRSHAVPDAMSQVFRASTPWPGLSSNAHRGAWRTRPGGADVTGAAASFRQSRSDRSRCSRGSSGRTRGSSPGRRHPASAAPCPEHPPPASWAESPSAPESPRPPQ